MPLLHILFNVRGLVYSNQIPEHARSSDVLNKNRARLCTGILIVPDIGFFLVGTGMQFMSRKLH